MVLIKIYPKDTEMYLRSQTSAEGAEELYSLRAPSLLMALSPSGLSPHSGLTPPSPSPHASGGCSPAREGYKGTQKLITQRAGGMGNGWDCTPVEGCKKTARFVAARKNIAMLLLRRLMKESLRLVQHRGGVDTVTL